MAKIKKKEIKETLLELLSIYDTSKKIDGAGLELLKIEQSEENEMLLRYGMDCGAIKAVAMISEELGLDIDMDKYFY